jgi:hypothetical protein
MPELRFDDRVAVIRGAGCHDSKMKANCGSD